MPSDVTDYKLVLTALHYALIEIRATKNIQKAQYLADVFHNVPIGVASGRTPEDIRRQVDQTASRLGCQDYSNGLFDTAVSNITR